MWRLESSGPILLCKQGNDCYTRFMGIFNVIFSLSSKYVPKLFIFQAQLMEIIIKMKSIIFSVLILSSFVEIYQCLKEYWWIFTELHGIKPRSLYSSVTAVRTSDPTMIKTFLYVVYYMDVMTYF
jgi:hypothetical protein